MSVLPACLSHGDNRKPKLNWIRKKDQKQRHFTFWSFQFCSILFCAVVFLALGKKFKLQTFQSVIFSHIPTRLTAICLHSNLQLTYLPTTSTALSNPIDYAMRLNERPTGHRRPCKEFDLQLSLLFCKYYWLVLSIY